MNKVEKFVPIKGFEGCYAIGDRGTVLSFKTGKPRVLRPRYNKDGYAHVALRKEGRAYEFLVNRLVAEHFIPNPQRLPTVNHKDGDKRNNRAENLEWATRSHQMVHAYKLGLKVPVAGHKNGNAVLSAEDVRDIRARYKRRSKQHGMRALAKEYGVSESVIDRVVRGVSYRNVSGA
jgi:hypothetical protein